MTHLSVNNLVFLHTLLRYLYVICLRNSEEKNCEFNDQTHIDAIAVKVGEYKETLAEKIAEWEQQVETWAETAAESLTATVQCLKPKSYCG